MKVKKQLPVTLDDITKMDYVGAGWFRKKENEDDAAKIIHAPEMRRLLLEEIERMKSPHV